MSLADTRVFPVRVSSAGSGAPQAAPAAGRAPVLRPVLGVPFMHKYRASVDSRKG
jgi:hypothetical protein